MRIPQGCTGEGDVHLLGFTRGDVNLPSHSQGGCESLRDAQGGDANPPVQKFIFDGAEWVEHWLDFDAAGSRERGESMPATAQRCWPPPVTRNPLGNQ